MSSEIPQLCAHCSSLFPSLCHGKRLERHNIPIIIDACRLCAWMWRTRLQGIVPLAKKVTYDVSIRSPGEYSLTVYMELETTRIIGWLELSPLSGSHFQYTRSSDLSSHTLSHNALVFLETKFRDCLNSHTACKNNHHLSGSFTPTRLLHLKGQSRSRISLVTREQVTSGCYFTLYIVGVIISQLN